MGEDKREVVDRLRRMETRLVKLFEHLGLDTQRKLPDFTPGSQEGMPGLIQIASMETTIKDILNAIPADWNPNAHVKVMHKDQLLMAIYRMT